MIHKQILEWSEVQTPTPFSVIPVISLHVLQRLLPTHWYGNSLEKNAFLFFFILSHTFVLKDSCRLFDQILKCMQWKVQHKCMIVGSCKIKAVLMFHPTLTQCRDEWPLGPERPRGKCHSWPLCTLCTSNQHTSQMSSQEDFWLNNFKWNFINVPELRKNIRCTLSQSNLTKKLIRLTFNFYALPHSFKCVNW